MWGFLKRYNIKVWCISLKNRADRYDVVCNEFKKVGIFELVNFHRPEKDKKGGKQGCFLSHLHCIENSLKENKHALIFEDDVKFSKNWKQKLKYIQSFLKNNKIWDIIRLGCALTSIHKSEFNTKHICLAQSYNAHSILYNKHIIKSLIDKDDFNENIHIDDYLHDNHYNDYVLLDQMCYQRAISSDNVWYSINIAQTIIQNKYIFENVQWLSNLQVRMMYCLPPYIQEKLGLWSILMELGKLSDVIYLKFHI
jgi:hypothetical protein